MPGVGLRAGMMRFVEAYAKTAIGLYYESYRRPAIDESDWETVSCLFLETWNRMHAGDAAGENNRSCRE